MSKITNNSLAQSGTWCFIAVGMSTVGVKGLTASLLYYDTIRAAMLRASSIYFHSVVFSLSFSNLPTTQMSPLRWQHLTVTMAHMTTQWTIRTAVRGFAELYSCYRLQSIGLLNKLVDELARTLLSFKRPTRPHWTATVPTIRNVHLGMVKPNASSPRVPSWMNWFFQRNVLRQCMLKGFTRIVDPLSSFRTYVTTSNIVTSRTWRHSHVTSSMTSPIDAL